MIRLPEKWLIYSALLAFLLVLVGIKVTAGKAFWSVTLLRPANLVTNSDDDYVKGLADRGIVRLPGYEPRPVIPLTAAKK